MKPQNTPNDSFRAAFNENELFKEAQRAAQKVCGNGGCICGYDCSRPTHKFKGVLATRPLKLLGENKTCPAEKFEVTLDTRSPFEKPYEDTHVSDAEGFSFCAFCDNSSFHQEDGYYIAQGVDLKICCDCPVHMAMECQNEVAAEARMS